MKQYAIAVAVLAYAVTTVRAEILKREPPMGKLREGQVVLVDDGSCPAGQIKRVVGGNHVKVGGTKRVERSRNCQKR
jgi:hypothetical protein